MANSTDGAALSGGVVLPGMLPRDGGLVSAADAEERLVRAVSRYLAVQALQVRDFGAGIGGVIAFRRRELEQGHSGKVMEPYQIAPWITQQEHASRPPSWWLSGFPLNEGDYTLHEDGTISIQKRIPVQWIEQGLPPGPQTAHEQPSASRRKLLYWSVPFPSADAGAGMGSARRAGASLAPPSQPSVKSVDVQAETTLDRLRRLSLALAENYQWKPEQATTFVLTGLIPYSRVWAERLPGALVRGRRPREISHKHLELALYTVEHEGKPLGVRLAGWNALHPAWAYTQITNFGRDSREAVRRLEERMGIEPDSMEEEQ